MKTLYYGGAILTMDRARPRAEALLVEDGRIVAVGERCALWDSSDERVDLQGRAMMPAFVDGHSHMVGMGMEQVAYCSLNGCESFDEIVERIAAFRKERALPPGEGIKAMGYDLAILREKAHPTAAVLDRLGADNPIACLHKSLHMGVYNTVAMERAGVLAKDWVCPAGGMVGRDEAGRLTGYFEESARGPFSKLFALKNPKEDHRKAILAAQELYLKNGFATVQQGSASSAFCMNCLAELAREGKLKVDVVVYSSCKEENLLRAQELRREKIPRFCVGGVKVFLDGSPQARTAWLRRPYEGETEYCGYPAQTDEALEKKIRIAVAEGMQVLAHCNGDAAAEQYLNVWEKVGAHPELRPVMIHAQMVGVDQLLRMPKLGMMPSFFIGHTWFWGDTHRENLGERALHISPVKTARRLGLPVSFHQDCPVTEPNMLHSIWCAVNRVTRSGFVLGAEERVDVTEALIAATNGGAYGYFQEKEKGILRVGALADLIVLDRDPTAVDPMELKDLTVLATIKEGEAVYQSDALSLSVERAGTSVS